MRFFGLAAIALTLACSPALAQPQPAARAASTSGARAGGVDGFARAAAENSLSEVLLSTIALQKTNDRRVENNAWTMLDHHSRAMGELAESLSDGAASLPSEPNDEQKANLERMRGLSGAQFDQAYFAHQLEAHQRAISLYEQAGQLPDEKVAQYARVTLPVLRAHRDIVQYRQSLPPQPAPVQ